MTAPLPFTFGIPLLPRACALNWPLIETLLDLTLRSALAQTDPHFRIFIAGHDRPERLPDDPRIEFLEADWPVEAVRADNLDRGRKTQLINRRVLENGGGLLMFLDADDWVDRQLVATARAALGPDQVVGLIESGIAADFHSLQVAPLPHPRIFDQPFHRICGSSSVLHLQPEDSDPLHADPHSILHEHYRMPETVAAHGGQLALLPVRGAYLINTSENHSETHGPFATWRQTFTRAVNRFGLPLQQSTAVQFGLGRDVLKPEVLK